MKPILLSAIACPKCHGELQYDAEHQQLICQTDKLVYAVKDGIPVLLENEAQPLVQPLASTSITQE
ncbi:Trm112 family protein [Gilliamella sp. wkB112]|uniref:Trm112 family protein n=1 Tax=Gilliamella sp. wkB112 TaxID=3120257 RepID=UPI00080EBAC3|nr:Trm112 family protein [Gilliamella apicola]OCG01080.1 hypothetical protein A9G12_00525 [Gilliamella apicola]